MEEKSETFYCSECNKSYKSYKSLWNHNNKFHQKQNTIKEYVCKNCKKSFNNKQNKYYHQKKCLINFDNNSVNSDTNSNVKEQVITINSTNTNSLNNNKIINSNNKTIIINNYGNDNLEYISEKFKERLFKNLLDEDEHDIPIPKLLENIKFNPNHKENHNVKIKSDRSKIGFYYDQNKWKAINKNELLDDLCNYSLKILSKYFEEQKNKLSDDIITQFQQFSHIAKLKSELRNQIKEKIENIAYIFTINNENELDF
jgi:hypothetical protein